jgi:hypothetical protein
MSGHLHHEKSDIDDIDLRAVIGVGFGVIVAAVVISVLVWLLFLYFSTREAHSAMTEFPLAASLEQRLPPEPRLQTDPREDLRALRASEDQVLQSYGWIDKSAGVVRITIDEAMKLTLERGLPARTDGGKKP